MGRISPMFLGAAVGAPLIVSLAVGIAVHFGRSSGAKPAANVQAKAKSPVTYLTLANEGATSDRPRQIPAFLRAELADIPHRLWSAAEAAAFLRSRGHRACCEEIRRGNHERPLVFPLSEQPRALHAFLDDVTRGDPDYRWEWMADCEVINLIPRKSQLDVPFATPGFHDRGLMPCVNDLHAPCKLSYGIFLMGNMKDPGRLENWPFSLPASRFTPRDYLNLLARQYDGMTWHVREGRSVLFEVHPQEEFDRVAEQLRSQVRQRDRQLREAADAAKDGGSGSVSEVN